MSSVMGQADAESRSVAGRGTGVAASAAPVDESRRISALDSVRGFALLGILLVNIHLFAAPFGEFILPKPPDGSGAADIAAFYFTKIFCEGRFYPLFSLLFGMGLVLQMRSVERRGGRFVPLYARRLLVLMLLGAVHAIGFWYGDILLIYGTVGWALLLVRRWSARSLLVTAGVILAIASVLSFGMSMLMVLSEQPPRQAEAAVTPSVQSETVAETNDPGHEDGSKIPDGTGTAAADASVPMDESAAGAGATTPATEPASSPLERLFEGFQDGTVTDPSSPGWMKAEIEAYRDGGFRNALGMRLFSYAIMVVFSFFGFGWHVLVMFLIGAALVKLDVLAPEGKRLRRRLMIVGLGVGMPLAVLNAVLPALLGKAAAMPIVGLLMMGTGVLTALGYFGAVFLLAESGRAAWLMRPLGSAGRMALTVYLSETVVATFLMYHWGLAMFGEFSRSERTLIAVAIYVPLVVLSELWLRAFRIGPMEWVWRTLTYLQPPPLLRRGAA